MKKLFYFTLFIILFSITDTFGFNLLHKVIDTPYSTSSGLSLCENTQNFIKIEINNIYDEKFSLKIDVDSDSLPIAVDLVLAGHSIDWHITDDSDNTIAWSWRTNPKYNFSETQHVKDIASNVQLAVEGYTY